MSTQCTEGEQPSSNSSLNFDSSAHLPSTPPDYHGSFPLDFNFSTPCPPVSPSLQPQPSRLPTLASSNKVTGPSTPRRIATFVASQSTQARRIGTPIHGSPSRTQVRPKKKQRTPHSSPKKRRSPRSIDEKLVAVFDTLAFDIKWSLGQFLYYVFRIQDDRKPDGKVHQTRRHASIVSRFMRGDPEKITYGPADILEAWLRTPDGRPQSQAEEAQMYALDTPYQEIKVGRPAITSFAVQVTRDRLLYERRQAVKPSGGLHASRTKLAQQSGRDFEEIDPTFIQNTVQLLKQSQPLTFTLLIELATSKRRSGVSEPELEMSQDYRPPELVVMQVLSSVNFSHNRYANRLQLATGIFYFATGVPNMVYRYASRVGMSVSYSTTYVTLQKLGEEDRANLRQIGQDPTRGLILRLDNIQMFHKQCEMRIGREDQVMMGTAGIAFEAENFDAEVVSIAQRQAKLAEGLRKKLTVPQLLGMIDKQHISLIGSLHWLKALVTYIPQLAPLKTTVVNLFRTEGAKFVIPPTRKTKAYPLSTNDKHESLVTELKDALLDFFEQMGQTQDTYRDVLCFVGGDGLTFEKMLQLQELVQFDTESKFDRLHWIVAFLELWHTAWTNLCRIFEAHWGNDLSRDPSTLGHSASKIKYKTPSNLKKVDYYSGDHLVNLVLDVRMIDCWRIYFGADTDIFEEFERREKDGNLPSLDELRKIAELLYQRYSSPRSYHRSMHGHDPNDEYSVPLGEPWEKPAWMTASKETTEGEQDSTEGAMEDAPKPFMGDQALAQSQRFMMDAWMSREVSEAVAAGDIGRVWEIFKVWVFTFAGSSHTKYPNYLLEMICTLELESTPELKEFFLENWLVNPSGKPGKAMEGDLFVEHNNETLKDIPQRQDSSWNGKYLREVVSPNTFRAANTKEAFIEGTGLKPATNSHPTPHTRPEFRTLSKIYREEGLHLFRPGREYDKRDRDVADLERGQERLRKGKLAQWITTTTTGRDLLHHEGASGSADTLIRNNGDGDEPPTGEPVEHGATEPDQTHPLAAAAELRPLAWRYTLVTNGDIFTDASIEDILSQEVANEERRWDDEEDFQDWQEPESEIVPEIEFNDDT